MQYGIAVLISGGGRSLENILERIERGQLRDVEVKCVLASKPSAGGIKRAENWGIPTRILSYRDYDTVESYSDAISAALDDFDIDLAVLAGWMHFYQIPERYMTKLINIHPSLIPAFCGKGYYGNRVHQAVVSTETHEVHVRSGRQGAPQLTQQLCPWDGRSRKLDFGAKVTGCTVHFADNEYDHGPIVLQRAVQVDEDDDVETLAARVFEEEKEALPEAIRLLSEGRVLVEGRKVRILRVGKC